MADQQERDEIARRQIRIEAAQQLARWISYGEEGSIVADEKVQEALAIVLFLEDQGFVIERRVETVH